MNVNSGLIEKSTIFFKKKRWLRSNTKGQVTPFVKDFPPRLFLKAVPSCCLNFLFLFYFYFSFLIFIFNFNLYEKFIPPYFPIFVFFVSLFFVKLQLNNIHRLGEEGTPFSCHFLPIIWFLVVDYFKSLLQIFFYFFFQFIGY